jgi:hypothetical protein
VCYEIVKKPSMARKIIKDFDPDAVVGFGGYAVVRSYGRPKDENSCSHTGAKQLCRGDK